MFLNLRNGAQVFILHKSQKLYVEIGTVEQPVGNMMSPYYPGMPVLPLDLTVRVGDRTVTYQRLPANVEVADVKDPDTGEQISVSCSREALNNEIGLMRKQSVDVVNSVDFHKQRIVTIDAIYNQLNPEQAEKEAQKREIDQLKMQMSDMTTNISELMRRNSELIDLLAKKDKGTSSEDSKKTKEK